jgi:hypothetical protein
VASATISAIDAAALADVGRFLNQNLNRRIAPEAWVAALSHPWCHAQPNYGFQLRAGTTLVGVFCAIYSDQTIEGRAERFCNPHTWCVLPDYRNQSLSLALALIKQRGYHFTMLTPNPKVAEMFIRLGFKRLDEHIVVFPNIPSPMAALREHIAESERDRIAPLLAGRVLRDFEAHRDILWLAFLAFGRAEDVCLVVYKVERWKRLSCARIIHLSDPAAFDRHRHLLQHCLLLRQGLLVSRVEARFLSRKPRLAYTYPWTQSKLFLSSTLRQSQVSNLYTELAALDI